MPKRKLEEDSEYSMDETEKEDIGNPTKMCRICLSENGMLKPLFGKDDKSKDMLRKVENTLQFEMKKIINLPTKICIHCFAMVEKFYEFMATSKDNQLELVRRFGQKSPKEETNKQDPEELKPINEMSDLLEILQEEHPQQSLKEDDVPETNLNNEVVIDEEEQIIEDYDYIELIQEDIGENEQSSETIEKPVAIVQMFETKKEDCPEEELSLIDEYLVPKSSVQFKCEECNLIFPSKIILKRHAITAHKYSTKSPKKESELNTQAYECGECGHLFNTEHLLRRHLKSHMTYEEVLQSCKFCDFKAKSMNQLQGHMAQDHPEQFQFQCDVCDKSYTSKVNLNIHKYRVHNQRTKCELCGSVVKNIKKHACAPAGSFTCPICNQQYKNKLSLQTHIYKKHKERSNPIDFSIMEEKRTYFKDRLTID